MDEKIHFLPENPLANTKIKLSSYLWYLTGCLIKYFLLFVIGILGQDFIFDEKHEN